MAAVKNDSLRTLAKKYGCSPQTISNLKKEGVDISDEKAVQDRLNTGGSSLPHTIPATTEGTGLRAAIERLQAAEVAAHEDYKNALKNAPDEAGRTLRAWQTILEQLRKVEDSNPSIEKENQNVITKEDISAVLSTLFANLKLELDSLPKRLSVSLLNRKREEIFETVTAEVERIKGELYECRLL